MTQTGEYVDMQPEEVVKLDTWTLCNTRHTIQVGVTKHSDNLTIFDDYFIVAFHGEDTSGGGVIEEKLGKYMLKVIEGVGDVKFGLDYLYEEGVMREKAIDYAQSMCDNCKTRTCKGKWCGGAVSIGIADKLINAWKKYNPFDAEMDYSSPHYTPYDADEKRVFGVGAATECGGGFGLSETWNWWKEFTGGCYHGFSGNIHRIRIKITNTFDGATTTKYDSELAGCQASYDPDDTFCFNGAVFKRFLINSPGTWNIKITPIATGTCNMLDYEHTYTYEVAEPEDWSPTPLQTMSTNVSQILQDAGMPVYITPVALVAGASLMGGLLFYRIWKKRKG